MVNININQKGQQAESRESVVELICVCVCYIFLTSISYFLSEKNTYAKRKYIIHSSIFDKNEYSQENFEWGFNLEFKTHTYYCKHKSNVVICIYDIMNLYAAKYD